ncbi:MAG: hypothetical protein OCC49_19545 [Fibrobacterales bacterium]
MIRQILKNSFLSLGVGFVAAIVCSAIESDYLLKYLEGNLITVLVALLAINTTTLGIVLVKIRDMVDSKNINEGSFEETKKQMKLSVTEQIGLIVCALIFLVARTSQVPCSITHINLLFDSAIIAVFVYGITILYDTANSVFVLLELGKE